MEQERTYIKARKFLFSRSASLLILLLLAGAPGCRESASGAPAPPTVQVAAVVRRDVPVWQEWVGVTDGLVNASIRAQVTGYLVRQAYREGDFVRKGQILFEIDPRVFRAALAQAGAQKGQADGQLARAEGQLSQAEGQRAQAESQRVQAQVTHVNALAVLDRVRPLAEQDAVSRKDLDDAVGAEGATRAAVAAAEANVAAAGANVVAAKAGILTAKAGVASAVAALEKARLDLEFTRIVSPIDGIAGIAKAQVGNLVGPAQGGELTTVSTLDPIKVYFTTSEQAYLAYMKPFATGTEANRHRIETPHELILADGTVYPHKGRFFAVDRQVDERTGTLRVALLFPNPGNRLRPGQFARVRVAGTTLANALLVPQRAISEIQGNYQVAVVGPGDRAELRTVRPTERMCALAVVEGDLKPGERVVVEGTQKVKQGQPVTAKAPPPGLTALLGAVPDAEGRCAAGAR